jgi:hypothetical protein
MAVHWAPSQHTGVTPLPQTLAATCTLIAGSFKFEKFGIFGILHPWGAAETPTTAMEKMAQI